MEAAETLHGDDEPVGQRPCGARDGVAGCRLLDRSPGPVGQTRRGPARRTGIGLGVKATVGRIVYSASQRGHIANPAMVVSRRSYGTPWKIVKRGPQFVQFTNG